MRILPVAATLLVAVAALAAAPLARSSSLRLPLAYDPLATARTRLTVDNREAVVPPACYAKTDGVSNPCYACHTVGQGRNHQVDFDLQEEYAFSETALTNRWSNLFVDRRARIAAISDDQALAWMRQDNYRLLRATLAWQKDYDGWRPDLDLDAGFDADGFARDGSGWRAVRYKPFPGAFFPTNGSAGDVFIRLPRDYRVDAQGVASPAIYAANLAILEAAIATPSGREAGLPATYLGGASAQAAVRFAYPEGTELMHTVRYVDPDAPNLLSRRMKEVRYMRKVRSLDPWAVMRAYEKEGIEKDEGHLPVFAGSPTTGLENGFGWHIGGFIEDEQGRLRVQTMEETLSCMGCHGGGVGVTVDHTFSFARKVPGAAGWRWQDLRGMVDAPQAGHALPEVLEYFQRVGAADELRANDEMLARFFGGKPGVASLDEAEVRRAAAGGDRDLAWLLAPSRARALRMAKAYMTIVREQSFALGRDPVAAPVVGLHQRIENGTTDLGKAGRVFTDGRLWLDWPAGVP